MVEMKSLKDRNEWLQARQGRIGGSDASAIVGMNPYRTNVELWQIKTGQLEQEDQPAGEDPGDDRENQTGQQNVFNVGKTTCFHKILGNQTVRRLL